MRLSLRKEGVVVRLICCFTLALSLALSPYMAFSQYTLSVKGVDRDADYLISTLQIQTNFRNRITCREYVDKLPDILKKRGYVSASVDSVMYDSLSAAVTLFLGNIYNWSRLDVDSIDKSILEAIGWNERNFKGRPLDPLAMRLMQNKILNFLENNGYPFALIRLDSISFDGEGTVARMILDKGPIYKIDSIRNLGTAKISTDFLQRYLNLPKGSIYRKDRLEKIDTKLNELPYVKQQDPWNITMLGTGSVLNLYLAPKKSSEINVLIGLLPSNEQLNSAKMLITGEANINLRNALGNGETIGLNWQQIQVRSPRLHLLFQQPYLFKSPFGLNFNFDLFKKDSSWVNIGMNIGAIYSLSSNQSGSVFFQNLSTNLLTVDTFSVKATRRLPDEADVHSLNLGIDYHLYTTDYRFNPRKGNEFFASVSAGIRNIEINNVIVKLQDNADPSFKFSSLYDTVQLRSYQFRVYVQGAHFFPLTRYSTLKASLTGGWFGSPDVFRNELFQIGGYKLLRGFDEESIFASGYAVSSVEYRYLIGTNSYLFGFFDFGLTKNKISSRPSENFMGTGLGMAFETKAGIFNISYAVGKRDESKFNLRQSKIHIGYVNYF